MQTGRGVRSKKLSHKNAIKQKKGKKSGPPPLDFLTTPSTPLKEFGQKTKDPLPRHPPWISNYCASMMILENLDNKIHNI
jgi:hypothetical protein